MAATLNDLYKTVVCPKCESGVGENCRAELTRASIMDPEERVAVGLPRYNYTAIHASRKSLAFASNDQLKTYLK